jgi:hypothetical protein
MKRLWKKVLDFIKDLYLKIKDETKEHIPTAIKAVEALKMIMDSPVDDIILGVIAATLPNKSVGVKMFLVKEKIHQELPKILLGLNMIDSIANITDTNEQLQAILNAIKLSPDEVKAEKYHIIASKLLVILSDGKISWGEAVIFSEFYYQTYYK